MVAYADLNEVSALGHAMRGAVWTAGYVGLVGGQVATDFLASTAAQLDAAVFAAVGPWNAEEMQYVFGDEELAKVIAEETKRLHEIAGPVML